MAYAFSRVSSLLQSRLDSSHKATVSSAKTCRALQHSPAQLQIAPYHRYAFCQPLRKTCLVQPCMQPVASCGSDCKRMTGIATPAHRHQQQQTQQQQQCTGSELRLLSMSPALLALALVPVTDLAEGLEAPVQLLYLLTLLGFLVVGAYLVVRQVLIRRELEEAAKVLGERIRSNSASAEDCFELGVILLRKKLYTQATKNLEKAKKSWDGEPTELAQVHNALGYAYFNMERTDLAIAEYKQAVELQPGYVTAWNNLGDALEKSRKFAEALSSYREALSYAPDNKVAQGRAEALQTKIERLGV